MKVGVLQFFSWSRRVPLTAVYERAFSRIAIMDQTGYDCVWLAEHHFNTYSVCPSINVMATHVAAAHAERSGSGWPCRWRRSTTRSGSPRKSP